MRWRPRLISEDTDTRVTKYDVRMVGDEIAMVFEVQFMLTPDEIRRAERESDMPPLEPPVRYPNAMALVAAINNDAFPAGVEFDDIVRYAEKVGIQHLVAPRSYHESGFSGGIEKTEADKILAALFHRTREKVHAQTGDDAQAKRAAQQLMLRARRPEFWGGDARASKGQPGSPKYRATVIPALVKHFMEVSRGPAIAAVKNYFGNFPKDWQVAIFGRKDQSIDYVDMEGASHFKATAPKAAQTTGRAKRIAKLSNDIEAVLTQQPAAEPKPQDTRRWITLYSMVIIPFGDDMTGFRGKFVAQFKRAVKTKRISQVGEQDGRPLYRWDTGIPGFNEWVKKMDEIGKGWASIWLKQILKSSSVVLADHGNDLSDSEILFHRKQAQKAAPQQQFIVPPTETPAQPQAQAPAPAPQAPQQPAQPTAQAQPPQFIVPPTEDVIKSLASRL